MEKVVFYKVKAEEEVPTDGDAYFVQTWSDYRAVAYYDTKNKWWRDVNDDDVLDIEFWYKPVK